MLRISVRRLVDGLTSTTQRATAAAAIRRQSSSSSSASAEKVTRIGIVGVPFDKGQKVNSVVHEGPKAIRDGGLIEHIQEFNGNVS